ncbi:rhodanese-like domain-containing protein [Phreatobacter sp. AB_2022a]|uniref:rhodanese-like domain-containing protein n=1 Tax=Phreatobacter sp. AB_2022a TaxID=3003134 RepID=UPI002286EDD1|nr:rhodanese-like domain-containing protein [Phreatobacter sp. AB_2022a]MCZ0735959.1 rhodanese-like domain-containing protein [Phreatobacter sp. AB_2022a]
MSSLNDAGYAGDVAPRASLEGLMQNVSAQLVDVRTTAEWAYVGSPDLKAAGKEPIRAEWQVFPTMTVDPGFVAKVEAALASKGVAKDAPLYFLCRSGVRSKAAAAAMTQAGYVSCFNVTGGFEGPPDPDGHRGRVAGWKVDGLPWTQT